MPRSNLRRTVKRAEKRVREGVDITKEKFSDIEDSTVKYIKKNPIKSVAIAAGVGIITGAVLYFGIESAVRARMRKQNFWNKVNPLNYF